MGSHASLRHLGLFKPLRPVRVKVLCKVILDHVETNSQKISLIVGDDEGHTMEATFVRDLAGPNFIDMEEGHCYELNEFSLYPISEPVRLTKYTFHIILTTSSVVSEIDPINNSNFFWFPSFDDVYQGLCHPKFSIDIYGVLVGVGLLEEYVTEPMEENNGFIDHRIRFFVLGLNNVVIKCVAHGTVARNFQALWNARDSDAPLCVLQFWKINWNEGRFKKLTNIGGFSKVIFEPNNVPEIATLRERIAMGDIII